MVMVTSEQETRDGFRRAAREHEAAKLAELLETYSADPSKALEDIEALDVYRARGVLRLALAGLHRHGVPLPAVEESAWHRGFETARRYPSPEGSK